MDTNHENDLINSWLSLTHIQMNIENLLDQALQANHELSLNEFYMLYFLSQAPDKRLKLQQLESMVGLSQSAMSRFVARFEAKGCGALRRYACEEDRRSVYTSLTDIGQEKVDKAYHTFNKVLLDALPALEMNNLLEAMLRAKQK
ncbi:MarR family transcriptional regulator [Neobacillus mesonae]|nr:MarR family transcriptional regulator [Neobacillus mesonae]